MNEAQYPVRCSEYGFDIDDTSETPKSSWKPCPNCGSLRRTPVLRYHETLNLHEMTKLKAEKEGEKKPSYEALEGDDLQRSTGKYVEKKRIIDRENDWYEERIVDSENGEVIHECKEPLSEHKGHGSAKNKKK
jgi:hypothetical protein